MLIAKETIQLDQEQNHVTELTGPPGGGQGVIEEWRVLPHFENYEVSNWGRVKNRQGKIISQCKHPKGYLLVGLLDKHIHYTRLVHGLVAEAFIGPQPIGYDVHHKDGNKLNNNATNLVYILKCEHGKQSQCCGEGHSRAKLNNQQVKTMRMLYKKQGFSYGKISRIFKIDRSHVTDIIQGKFWKHVKQSSPWPRPR